MDRFLKYAAPEPNTGCWLWTGCGNKDGYGQFWFGRLRPAHRVAYEFYVGPIPDGMQLDHICRVRSCVNPDHLRPVTAQENIDLAAPFRVAVNEKRKKTHCTRGHAFDQKNTYFSSTGAKCCRACTYLRTKKWRASIRDARQLGDLHGNDHGGNQCQKICPRVGERSQNPGADS